MDELDRVILHMIRSGKSYNQIEKKLGMSNIGAYVRNRFPDEPYMYMHRMEDRDMKIVECAKSGMYLDQIAGIVGLTTVRVSGILRSNNIEYRRRKHHRSEVPSEKIRKHHRQEDPPEKMWMSAKEIYRSYITAKDRSAQITILSQLNCCHEDDIKYIIDKESEKHENSY